MRDRKVSCRLFATFWVFHKTLTNSSLTNQFDAYHFRFTNWYQFSVDFILGLSKFTMKLPLTFLALVLLSGISNGDADENIHHRKLFTAPSGTGITGRYIVTLNDGVSDVLTKAKELLSNSGATVDFEYKTVFKGFAVGGLVAKFLTIVLDDDMVVSVEQDQEIVEDQSFKFNQASPADWALDRIDQKSLPLDGKYQYSYTGKGVYVFIIDSGITLDHSEFSGRVQCGYIAVPNEDCYDVRGHGSHVAGIAAGKTVS
jgi:subtilisin family serine protease